jgi:hypothetical protein
MRRSGGNCGRRSGRRESEHSCDENGNESLLHGPPVPRYQLPRVSPPCGTWAQVAHPSLAHATPRLVAEWGNFGAIRSPGGRSGFRGFHRSRR